MTVVTDDLRILMKLTSSVGEDCTCDALLEGGGRVLRIVIRRECDDMMVHVIDFKLCRAC